MTLQPREESAMLDTTRKHAALALGNLPSVVCAVRNESAGVSGCISTVGDAVADEHDVVCAAKKVFFKRRQCTPREPAALALNDVEIAVVCVFFYLFPFFCTSYFLKYFAN